MQKLREVLVESIVPAGAMQIDVVDWKDGVLELSAPLSANVNDKGIGFAGSSYSLAVLCGWGAVFQVLADAGFCADIAVFKSSCDFNLPVRSDMRAVCRVLESEKKSILDSFSRKGRAKAELMVEVFSEGEKCASFTGRYVVRPKNSFSEQS